MSKFELSERWLLIFSIVYLIDIFAWESCILGIDCLGFPKPLIEAGRLLLSKKPKDCSSSSCWSRLGDRSWLVVSCRGACGVLLAGFLRLSESA